MMSKPKTVNSFITASPAGECFQSRLPRADRLVWVFASAICLTLLLAVWQLQRGQSRAALLQQFDQAAQRAPQPFAQTQGDPTGQRISLSGGPVGPAIFLQNSYRDGTLGLLILQPVRLVDGGTLLIDRGWQPGTVAAPLSALPGNTLTTRWTPRPQRFVLPGALHATAGYTDALDDTVLASRYPGLHPGLAVLEPPSVPLHLWPARPIWQPQRHYAYALQWLLMSVCLGICLIRYRRRCHE